jgi:hypothetical protein
MLEPLVRGRRALWLTRRRHRIRCCCLRCSARRLRLRHCRRCRFDPFGSLPPLPPLLPLPPLPTRRSRPS